ncbi:MAG: hypothetical protein AAF629_08915 [Chloroflexota bacterium]
MSTNNDKSLAIAQIVSAIIAKDFKVSGVDFEEYSSELEDGEVDVWDYERIWSSTDGVDLYLGHGEVILSDAEQRTMTLRELIQYVDSCLDQAKQRGNINLQSHLLPSGIDNEDDE